MADLPAIIAAPEVVVQTLDDRETSIRNGVSRIRDLYWQIGEEIISLHQDGTWQQRGMAWEVYCQEHLGISDSYASRLMTAARVYGELPEGTPMPRNESVIREIRDYPNEVRVPALQWAAEIAGTGKVTAKLVRLAVRAAAAVAAEALETRGYVTDEEGEQGQLNRAITKDIMETMLRQSEHIANKSNMKFLGKFDISSWGLKQAFGLTVAEMMQGLDDGYSVSVRLYIEKPDEAVT